MALQSIEFNIDDIRDRINRIYNQSNGSINDFMNISNYQFTFSIDLPWAISEDGYPNQNGILAKTTQLSEGGQIIVNIYYEKLVQTINLIFNNFYNLNIANRVCDLYIEFLIAHELAHVSQLIQNRPHFLAARDEEDGILEWNRSYEIEADNRATDYMRHMYNENGNLIGLIGRAIHENFVNNTEMIRGFINQVNLQ